MNVKLSISLLDISNYVHFLSYESICNGKILSLNQLKKNNMEITSYSKQNLFTNV